MSVHRDHRQGFSVPVEAPRDDAHRPLWVSGIQAMIHSTKELFKVFFAIILIRGLNRLNIITENSDYI